MNEPNPVVQLSFQEACDDPNAYCYLWAVRGGLSRSDPVGDMDHPVPVFGPPAATMFSLCYDEKVWIQDYGHLYKVMTRIFLGCNGYRSCNNCKIYVSLLTLSLLSLLFRNL